MKATVNRADLANAARYVQGAIGKNPSLPILSGMLVSAVTSSTGPNNSGFIALEAFDYDNALRAMVPAEVDEPGHHLVPGHAFAGFVNAIDGDLINLSDAHNLKTAQILVIEAGTSTADFYLMNEDDYPQLPKMNTEVDALTVDAEVLRGVVGRVSAIPAKGFDTPEAQARPWAACLMFGTLNGDITITACTPYAAGDIRLALDEPVTRPLDAIVPASVFLAVLREMSGFVSLAIGGVEHGNLIMQDEQRAASIRTIDTLKPPVERILAARPAGEFTVNLAELRAAIRLLGMTSDRVALHVDPGQVRLVTYAPSKGELVAEVTSFAKAETTSHGVIYTSTDHLGRVLAGLSEDPTFNFDPEKVTAVAVTDHRGRYVFQPLRTPEGVS